MWPKANAAIPPSTGSGSGTKSCSAPPLKKSPTVPQTMPVSKSATVVAAADRLNPRKKIQATATRNSDEPRCEKRSTIRGGHGRESPRKSVSSVPPKSVVAHSGQKPAASRLAIVELSTPPGKVGEIVAFSDSGGTWAEGVRFDLGVRVRKAKSLSSITRPTD